MIDVYKLEGRRIFKQSKLEIFKRWYLSKQHRILFVAFGAVAAKEIFYLVYSYFR